MRSSLLRELLLRAARSAPRPSARDWPRRCRRRRRWPCRGAAPRRRAPSGSCADRRVACAASQRRSPSARASAYAATASLSSGTRSARRRSSASTSPQAAAGAVAGARQPVVEQHGEARRRSPRSLLLPRSARQRGYQRRPRGSTRAVSRVSAARDRSARRARRGRTGRAARAGRRCARASPTTAAGSAPPRAQLREPDGAVALREPLAVGAEQQRDVRVAGDGPSPSSSVEPELTRRRVRADLPRARRASRPGRRRRRRPRAGRRRRRRCGAGRCRRVVASSVSRCGPARSSRNSTAPSMRTRSDGCAAERAARRALARRSGRGRRRV